jgi:hypothetical protein
MWVDPLGLFKSGDVLQKGDGVSNINKTVNQEATDIVDMQTRLIALGYLYPSAIKYGKFDKNTEEAVKALQESMSMPPTGKVDIKTWRTLGLYTEYQVNSAKTELEKALGTGWAWNQAYDLVSEQHNGLMLDVNGKPRVFGSWNYMGFTLAATYYKKIECAEGNKDLLGFVTFAIDTGVAFYYNFREAELVIGPEPRAVLFAAGWNTLTDMTLGKEAGYPSSVDANSVSDYLMGGKVEKAEKEFATVVQTPLLFTLDSETWGFYAKPSFANEYYNEVSKLTNDIAWQPLTSNTYLNVENARIVAMEYMLDVARLNVSNRYRKDFTDELFD